MKKSKELYAVVGRNISHSFSPDYFNNKFREENLNAEFILLDISSIDELPSVIKSTPHLKGFSVTIPYKQEMIKLLSRLDPVAGETGAVNCVKITDSGMSGYNTDTTGFVASLKPLLNNKKNLKALILGTGGASRAAAWGLNRLSIPYLHVSRNKSADTILYNDLNEEIIKNHCLIINTTPLGMFPDIDAAPDIPYEYLNNKHILFDLVYNPEETLFLKKGKEKGALIKNGLEMLHIQAEAAWKIWQK